jgi:hypothetical protein
LLLLHCRKNCTPGVSLRAGACSRPVVINLLHGLLALRRL